jgi:DNA segregation ATPase FtsK/SpoIIIE-like protein
MLALIQKLNGLGINAKPSSVEQGPVVTAYLFDLDHSESITRIMKRSEDFALSLGADKVIIQRIKDKIVVFVPNKKREIVDYKDILYWYIKDPEVQKQHYL